MLYRYLCLQKMNPNDFWWSTERLFLWCQIGSKFAKMCGIVSMLTRETNMLNMVNIPAKYDRISIASTNMHQYQFVGFLLTLAVPVPGCYDCICTISPHFQFTNTPLRQQLSFLPQTLHDFHTNSLLWNHSWFVHWWSCTAGLMSLKISLKAYSQ